LRFVGCLTGLFAVGELLAEAERLTGSGQAAALIPRAVPQDHAKALSSERDRALLSAFQALAALAVWARAQPAPPDDPSALRVWLTVRFLVLREIHHGIPAVAGRFDRPCSATPAAVSFDDDSCTDLKLVLPI
jgi:hypothetical protein